MLRLVASAAAGPSFLVPSSRGGFPVWLSGPLRGAPGTDATEYGVLFLLVFAGYLAVLWGWRALPTRVLIGTIVLVNLVLLLGPPLLSADVMGYLSYARLGTHGIDPYVHGAAAAPTDAIRPFLRWHNIASPYGPLFTVASYALVPLGIAGGLWAAKALAVACSLGCVALTWSIASRLELPPAGAVAFVGLNPVLLINGVGGAHNDLVVALVTLAAIWWVVAGHERAAGAGVVIAAGLKASAVLLLPYMLAGSARDGRRRLLAGAAAAAAAVAAVALAAFGSHSLNFVDQLSSQQRFVAVHSVPSLVARATETSLHGGPVRIGAGVLLAVVVVVTLVRALHGADWIACAGWATLTLLVTTAWLVPWYLVWLLPLAALGRDRRLALATLAFTGYLVATHVPFLWDLMA